MGVCGRKNNTVGALSAVRIRVLGFSLSLNKSVKVELPRPRLPYVALLASGVKCAMYGYVPGQALFHFFFAVFQNNTHTGDRTSD